MDDINNNKIYDLDDFIKYKNNKFLEKFNMGKKFDICMMNPPYQHGLGNSFLHKVLNISDKVITIQPLSWLIAKTQTKKITKIVDNSTCHIETINGLDNFDAGLIGDCAVQYIDTTKKGKIYIYGKEYDKCEDIKPYSNDDILEDFANIIIPTIKETVWDNIKDTQDPSQVNKYENNPDDNWWCIKIPKIRGHVAKGNKKESNDFYTIISNDNTFLNKMAIGKYETLKVTKNRSGNLNFLYVAFNKKQELYNFINYIKTDFVRACLTLTKKGTNLHMGELRIVPWQDFSQDIFAKSPREIDDYLFKKYNINDEIRKHIEEILPDYYGIRK